MTMQVQFYKTNLNTVLKSFSLLLQSMSSNAKALERSFVMIFCLRQSTYIYLGQELTCVLFYIDSHIN